MNWKGHLAVGIGFIIFLDVLFILLHGELSKYLDVSPMTLGIANLFGFYCALLPDIDIGTSKVFHFTFVVMALIVIYSALMIAFTGNTIFYVIVIILISIFQIFILGLRHRGNAHAWWASFVAAGIFGIITMNITVAMFCFFGYLTHAIMED